MLKLLTLKVLLNDFSITQLINYVAVHRDVRETLKVHFSKKLPCGSTFTFYEKTLISDYVKAVLKKINLCSEESIRPFIASNMLSVDNFCKVLNDEPELIDALISQYFEDV